MVSNVVSCCVSDLLTGRRQGCTGSSARQTPPSYGRSSGLHLANENSTGTGCNRRRVEVGFMYRVHVVYRQIHRLIILLTGVLGQGWGLRTHAALQMPGAPWCWSHPCGRNKKIRFLILFHFEWFLVFREQGDHLVGRPRTPRRSLNVNPEQEVRKTAFPFLWKHFSTWILSSSESMFVPLLIPGSNLNSWPMLNVSPPWGGRHPSDGKQLKPNPDRLLSVAGLFGHWLGFGEKVNSWSQAAVIASLIVFVEPQGPPSRSCIISVLCIVQIKSGIFRHGVFCFLWKAWVEYKAELQDTNNRLELQ